VEVLADLVLLRPVTWPRRAAPLLRGEQPRQQDRPDDAERHAADRNNNNPITAADSETASSSAVGKRGAWVGWGADIAAGSQPVTVSFPMRWSGKPSPSES